MSDKLDQFNIEFNSILTIYESYALRQVITNLKKIGIHIVSKNIITTRLIEEKSVLKRDKMLRNLQTELTYGTLTKESVPEIFYNKPALLNEEDFAVIIEENRRKQHSLKVDRELRILQSLYHDLEKQLKKEQQCNQQLEQKLKQANVNTGKVRNSYKKTIDQYKSVLADHDLKLWQFLKIYVEYRFIQVKNLFKQDKNKKRFQQKIKEYDSISTEDLQRLKDKFEN